MHDKGTIKWLRYPGSHRRHGNRKHKTKKRLSSLVIKLMLALVLLSPALQVTLFLLMLELMLMLLVIRTN